MTGHMGDDTVTVQNLELFDILAEENVILIRGAVPGGKNGYLLIANAVKKVLYKRKVRERRRGEVEEPDEGVQGGRRARRR